MREIAAEPSPSASLWKASSNRLVGGYHTPDYIEATPDAVWMRTDPFRDYRPVVDRVAGGKPTPHERFSTLANMALKADQDDIWSEQFHKAMKLFADRHGLLGWFREEFGMPLLPEREVGLLVLVAPDTIIDRYGRLREIDPATEGKYFQEQRMLHRDEVWTMLYGQPPPRPEDYVLEPEELILPCELRFRRQAADFVRTGYSRRLLYPSPSRTFTYEEIRHRYGLRLVYDPQNANTGVSVISTREPVSVWRQRLRNLAEPPHENYLNVKLEGVSPMVVRRTDGEDAGSWSCSSLLEAVHLMQFLDSIHGVRMQRCQAPDCYDFFRVGPRSKPRLYCHPSRERSRVGVPAERPRRSTASASARVRIVPNVLPSLP
jgi:hypothetical protein